MFPEGESFYARERMAVARASAFHDQAGRTDCPSERLLQSIWHHQRLRREALRTADGEGIRVLHPGFASVEGGPDFRGAVVQVGTAAPRCGDVEIDLRTGGWHAHGHDRNPAFKNVILQVLWEEGAPAAKTPPGLALKPYLDAPLEDLALSLENVSLRLLPQEWRGKCGGELQALEPEKLAGLLREAARVRFEGKAGQLRARARQAGWEQALWEGLFRGLGYKHNAWPMHNLAEARGRWQVGAGSAFEYQARLLGIGGLLPDDLSRAQRGGESWLRRVWDLWWRERDGFRDCQLPRSVWRFHGLRPANHPERRLVLAGQWLAAGNLPGKLEKWGLADGPEGELAESLREVLDGGPDDFWSRHWTLRSPILRVPQPLLGAARVTDLAVNVILPWLWVRALEGKNDAVRSTLERRYHAWPAGEDNAVLKLARQRLLGAVGGRCLRRAAAQQGLLQIVRDYCGNSNAVCAECLFPEVVQRWSGTRAETGATHA